MELKKEVNFFSIIFFLFFILINIFFHYIRSLNRTWDIPYNWPVSEGEFLLPTINGLVFIILAVGLLFIWFKKIDWFLARFRRVILWCSTFLILTNGFHGVHIGFVQPIQSDFPESKQYFQEINKVNSFRRFLKDYELLQPNMSVHARTHPPGPVLLMKLSSEMLHFPWLISIVLGFFSFLIMGISFRWLLKYFKFTNDQANLITFLMLCCTQMQVYSIFTADAVIASLGCCLIAASFLQNKIISSIAAGALLLSLLFLSFGAIFFFIPLLYLSLKERRLAVCFASIIIACLGLAALKYFYGYSWLNSFHFASMSENPNGFRLLTDPITYFATRLEDIFEPILFFGPLITYFIFKVFKTNKDIYTLKEKLMLVSLMCLLVIFITGAYHTGETARACLFAVPIVFLGISSKLQEFTASQANREYCIKWIIGYTLAHQFIMTYFW